MWTNLFTLYCQSYGTDYKPRSTDIAPRNDALLRKSHHRWFPRSAQSSDLGRVRRYSCSSELHVMICGGQHETESEGSKSDTNSPLQLPSCGTRSIDPRIRRSNQFHACDPTYRKNKGMQVSSVRVFSSLRGVGLAMQRDLAAQSPAEMMYDREDGKRQA